METKTFGFGPFLIDPARRLLQRDCNPVPLSSKAFETLLFLVGNSDRLVKKDELMAAIWPHTTVEENNLSQSISAIRKALGDTAQEHRYIETVPGWGYRFAAPVTPIAEQKPPAIQGRNALPLTSRPRVSKAWISVTAVVLLALIAGAIFYRRQRARPVSPQSPAHSSARVPARRSLAVVGFQNLSADRKQNSWLSTALPEMLRTELAGGGQLRVISGDDLARVEAERAASRTAASPDGGAPPLQWNAGSDLLVAGSYVAISDQHTGTQIRVDVRLEDAKTREVIGQIAETGGESELFDLVSRAGVRLRQKLGISGLSPNEVVMARAASPASAGATQLYAEGLGKLRVFDAMGARAALQRAVALDPHSPLAHAALADAWSALGYDSRASQEARQAFQLSKDLSPEEQLSIEGRYRMISTDWEKAVLVYRTLFDLHPDDLDYGLQLAAAQTDASKGQDALATLDGLRSLSAPDGNDPRIDLESSDAWDSQSDFKQMEGALHRAAERSQGQGHTLLLARARSQQCYGWRMLGEPRKAMDACAEARKIYVAAGDQAAEAHTLRLLGDVVGDADVPGALRLYQQALGIDRRIGHLEGEASDLNQAATLYSNAGEHAIAKRYLERALAIFQRVEDEVSATGIMINISDELSWQGRLAEARRNYQHTSELAARLGNKDMKGVAILNIACVDQLRGDLKQAQVEFEQARMLFEEVQDRRLLASAVTGRGEIAMAGGDFETAHRLYQSAVEIGTSAHQEVLTAEGQLDLALLSEEKGDTRQAETPVRKLVELFAKQKSNNDEATATALLARILLSEGKSAEAQAMAQRSLAIAKRADMHIRLSVALTAARVRGSVSRDRRGALASLEQTIAHAHRLGYVAIELEARLARGEIELQSGGSRQGKVDVQAVQRDAMRRGFKALANRAAAAAAAA